MTIELFTPQEVLLKIAEQAKMRRLLLNLSQEGLALRSGISLGSLKRFERTGQISLESLLKLAIILESLKPFAQLFQSDDLEKTLTLDEILKKKRIRKRGTVK